MALSSSNPNHQACKDYFYKNVISEFLRVYPFISRLSILTAVNFILFGMFVCVKFKLTKGTEINKFWKIPPDGVLSQSILNQSNSGIYFKKLKVWRRFKLTFWISYSRWVQNIFKFYRSISTRFPPKKLSVTFLSSIFVDKILVTLVKSIGLVAVSTL